MATRKNPRGNGTLAEQAHYLLKRSILRGEFPEGSFLSEAEITMRFKIGRTPFREACNRLHNEQLLEVVPRRGYYVPEISFRAVRDLLEARLILESVAAELAAQRATPEEAAEFERIYQTVLARATDRANPDDFVEANTAFHLHLGRMAHNRELETMLRGVLERSTRLFYMIARASAEPERDVRELLAPVVDAVRRQDAAAGHQAVIRDITHGQMNVLGRDLWEKAR